MIIKRPRSILLIMIMRYILIFLPPYAINLSPINLIIIRQLDYENID